MRLFIAEKPSLARSIAAVLSKPQQNHKLYIQAGDDIVAWAAGHLQKGDFVQVPIHAFTSTDWVPQEYFRKNMWGKRKPFNLLKNPPDL